MSDTAELDELTTPGEVAPKLKSVDHRNSRQYPCPDCSEVFDGPGASGKRYWHQVREHGLEQTVRSVGKTTKGTAKKAPAAKKTTSSTPQAKKPEPAQPVRKRQSAADVLTLILALGGRGVAKFDPPVGSMIALEAPIAGPMLDKSFAGTPVDKWFLQPIAGGFDRFEEVATLLIPPAGIAVLERYPNAAPVVLPMLRESIRGLLPQLLKAKKAEIAEAKETEKAAEDLVDLDPEFAFLLNSVDEHGNKLDPVDAFLMMLLPPQPADADAPPA